MENKQINDDYFNFRNLIPKLGAGIKQAKKCRVLYKEYVAAGGMCKHSSFGRNIRRAISEAQSIGGLKIIRHNSVGYFFPEEGSGDWEKYIETEVKSILTELKCLACAEGVPVTKLISQKYFQRKKKTEDKKQMKFDPDHHR